MLKRRPEDIQRTMASAEKIDMHMDRADRMIRDLLDANRLKAGESIPLKLEPCHLNKIARDVLQDLETIYGKRFVLEECDSQIHGIWDREAIYRIMENLLSNGVKYGSARGDVTLKLDRENDGVRFSIHNEGSFIEPTIVETLFASYHRSGAAVEGQQRGWGIGLTLCRALVDDQQGTITVESSREAGTVFLVRLPHESQ